MEHFLQSSRTFQNIPYNVIERHEGQSTLSMHLNVKNLISLAGMKPSSRTIMECSVKQRNGRVDMSSLVLALVLVLARRPRGSLLTLSLRFPGLTGEMLWEV